MGRIYTCLSVCGGSLTDGRDMDTDNRQTDRQPLIHSILHIYDQMCGIPIIIIIMISLHTDF